MAKKAKKGVLELQAKTLLAIIEKENCPFIYNEIEVNGEPKLVGHFKIQGYPPKRKPMTDEELKQFEKKNGKRP